MPADLVANAGLLQVAYGATIASFLGGVHWGTAMGGFGGGMVYLLGQVQCRAHSVVQSRAAEMFCTLTEALGFVNLV